MPALGDDGTPIWEPGDTNLIEWTAPGLGSCHGAPRNEVVRRNVAARVYLTDARTVVVSDHFAKGSTYRTALGFADVSTIIASKASKLRAQRATRGSFLYGQMRHRWINGIVYSQRRGREGENTVRICASELSAFGDRETVMLIVHLDSKPGPLRDRFCRRAAGHHEPPRFERNHGRGSSHPQQRRVR